MESGQTLHCNVLIEIGQIVQCEVFTSSGQTDCEVLTDNGQTVQCEILTRSGQSVQCELLTVLTVCKVKFSYALDRLEFCSGHSDTEQTDATYICHARFNKNNSLSRQSQNPRSLLYVLIKLRIIVREFRFVRPSAFAGLLYSGKSRRYTFFIMRVCEHVHVHDLKIIVIQTDFM